MLESGTVHIDHSYHLLFYKLPIQLHGSFIYSVIFTMLSVTITIEFILQICHVLSFFPTIVSITFKSHMCRFTVILAKKSESISLK